jgi:hypothetical protein
MPLLLWDTAITLFHLAPQKIVSGEVAFTKIELNLQEQDAIFEYHDNQTTNSHHFNLLQIIPL